MSNNIAEKEPGPAQDPAPAHTPPVEEEKKKREYKDFGHEEEGPTRMFTFPFRGKHNDLSFRNRCQS
jgi:hypothetical protein